MTFPYYPRTAWTNEPNGWAHTTEYGGLLRPLDVTELYLHYPGDGDVIYEGLTAEQVMEKLRGYRDYHTAPKPRGKGWNDIGYPGVVDQSGRRYEAAGFKYVAAHTAGKNFTALAFLLMVGNEEEPTTAMIDSVNEWYLELSANRFINMDDIKPHKAAQQTSCPGTEVTDLIIIQAFGPSTYRGETMAKMVSPFEGRRTYGFDGTKYGKSYEDHQGLDIAPPEPGQTGRPVHAPFDAYVKYVRTDATPQTRTGPWYAPYRTGNHVLLANEGAGTSNDGEGQFLNHMRPVVQPGQFVKAGTIVGYNDRSGNQSGPHLHYENWSNWRDHRTAYDPEILFDKYNIKVGSKPITSAADAPQPTPSPDYSEAVEVLQGYLKEMGYYTGRQDGKLGPMTADAIEAFQRDHGLKPDRVWGTYTDSRAKLVLGLRSTPNLLEDGDYGQLTAIAEQWRLKDIKAGPFYMGRIDGKPGEMHWTGKQKFLIRAGYNLGPAGADGDFGNVSTQAEQTWLVDMGYLPSDDYVDGKREKITITGLQQCLNAGDYKIPVPKKAAPEPTPPPQPVPTEPEPKPKPKPEPTPTPEPTPAPGYSGPSAQAIAKATVDELARRTSIRE